MNLSRAVVILFALNLVDALVTVFWVRGGLASETNQIMAWLLDIGPAPFLLVKLAMGTVTAAVLLYGSQYRLAKIGVTLALFAYGGAFVTHVFTGLAAAGYLS